MATKYYSVSLCQSIEAETKQEAMKIRINKSWHTTTRFEIKDCEHQIDYLLNLNPPDEALIMYSDVDEFPRKEFIGNPRDYSISFGKERLGRGI